MIGLQLLRIVKGGTVMFLAKMKKVPKGKLITINEIRSILAKRHGASIGCPITTGIFAWIAAHAAMEEATEGKKRIIRFFY